MTKILITETQLKTIIDSNINEQKSKLIFPGGSASGTIKMVNGKIMLVVNTEMGNHETIGPFTLKFPVKNGQDFFITNKKGKIILYGPNPKNPKGENIPYN